MPALRTTTVIIGAGQAGLAMSRCLAERSIDHVVLERGEVANAWRTERWDSLRHMQLIMAIEDEFGVTFADDDIPNLLSLRAIRDTVGQLAQ